MLSPFSLMSLFLVEQIGTLIDHGIRHCPNLQNQHHNDLSTCQCHGPAGGGGVCVAQYLLFKLCFIDAQHGETEA